MRGILDAASATSVALGLILVLAGTGLTIAWLPAVSREGWTILLPRILVLAGLAAVVLDGLGLGAVLGLGLVALGALASYQSRPPADLPRPRRGGIIAASVLTGIGVLAAAHGWWLLDRVPDLVAPFTATALGFVGTLATLAIADRERVRLRDHILATQQHRRADPGT